MSVRMCTACGVHRVRTAHDDCYLCRRRPAKGCKDCGEPRDGTSPRCARCKVARDKKKRGMVLEPRYCEMCQVSRVYNDNTHCNKCRRKADRSCSDCDAERDGKSPRCAACRVIWSRLMLHARQARYTSRPHVDPCPRCKAPKGLISEDGFTICETCGYMPDDPQRIGAWIVVGSQQNRGVRQAAAAVKDWAEQRGIDAEAAVNYVGFRQHREL